MKTLVNTHLITLFKVIQSNTKPSLTLIVALASSTFFASTMTHAESTTIPVDLADANATKHEIALLQVLSEVCPPMLNKKQRSQFYKTYNSELKQKLPNIKNPKAAIQYLSTQQDYKGILSSMRSWTISYSREENFALCTELATVH